MAIHILKPNKPYYSFFFEQNVSYFIEAADSFFSFMRVVLNFRSAFPILSDTPYLLAVAIFKSDPNDDIK